MTVKGAGVIVERAAGEADRVVAVGRERPLGDRVAAGLLAGQVPAWCTGQLAGQHRRGRVVDRHAVHGGVDEPGRRVGQGGVGRAVDLGLGIGGDGQAPPG